jgi:Fis family transcriptional regulator, factor for inversion stimulation protein
MSTTFITSENTIHPIITSEMIHGETLADKVENSVAKFLTEMGDQAQTASNIYNMVMAEIEAPLIKAVMRHTKGNQSKAAILLGISRGTLRKKLKQYDIERIG